MKIKKIKNNLIFYSEKYMSRNLFQIVLVIFLFNYQACQDLDEDTMKALGCLSLIRKLDNDKQQDQRMVSAILLSCFVNVEESQVKKLISSQYSNKMELSKSEVDKLVDMQSLQSKYSQSELIDYSKKLNTALGNLKNMEQGGPYTSKGSKKGSNKSTNNGGGGLIGFLISNIISLFNPNDSFLFLIGLFLMIYFGLKGLRKLLDKSNKSNKNNKKKGKKIE
jgi:hypothetical protein